MAPVTAVEPQPGPAAVSPAPGLQVPKGRGDQPGCSLALCGVPRGAWTLSLVTCVAKHTPPGVPSALGLQPQVWVCFPSSIDRKAVFGGWRWVL